MSPGFSNSSVAVRLDYGRNSFARDSEAKFADIADVLEQLSTLDSPSLTP